MIENLNLNHLRVIKKAGAARETGHFLTAGAGREEKMVMLPDQGPNRKNRDQN